MAVLARLKEWLGSGSPLAVATAPAVRPTVQAFSGANLDDPALGEFMRGRASVTGIAVGGKEALRNSTFFRACSLIAGSIGMLPIHLIRRKADGTTAKAKDHPLYKVLLRRPNSYQTAFQFKSHMQLLALLDGNAYALVIRSAGKVKELIPLPRRSVTPDRKSVV